jgi:hypothetical protein
MANPNSAVRCARLGQSALGHLTARPHAAVVGEYLHSQLTERFRVISGRFGARIVGVERTLVAGHQGVPSSVSEVVPGLGRWVSKRPKRAMAGCLVWCR